MSLGTIGACQKKMSDGDWPCPNPGYVLCCSLRGVYPRAGTHAARPTAARTLTLHGAARAIGARRLDWRALAAATSPKPKAGRTFGVRLASFKLETGPAIRTMCWLQLFVWCVCVCVCECTDCVCVLVLFFLWQVWQCQLGATVRVQHVQELEARDAWTSAWPSERSGVVMLLELTRASLAAVVVLGRAT